MQSHLSISPCDRSCLGARPSHRRLTCRPEREKRHEPPARTLFVCPRPHRGNAHRGAYRLRHRPMPAFRQAREPESRGLDQGPYRPLHDRRRRTLRTTCARRHDRGGYGRQYRPRPCPGRHTQGLPHHSRRARQDVARKDPASARPWRGGPPHTLGCRQGTPRILPGHGRKDRGGDSRRLLCQPIRQSRQSAGA